MISRSKKRTSILPTLNDLSIIPAISPVCETCIQQIPTCPCDGGCPRCAGVIQTKLTIGQPNDKYEREADRIADEVMRIPEPHVQRTGICSECEEEDRDEFVQTKPLADKITPLIQRQIEPEDEEEEEEEIIQPKGGIGQTPGVATGLESCIQTLKGGGQPLPPSTRAFFEPRFGRNFGGVRVHRNIMANEMAGVVKARAFTVGNDIIFGPAQYEPYSVKGRKLIAHELTHVVQQSGSYSMLMRWDSPQQMIRHYSTPTYGPFGVPAGNIIRVNELGIALYNLVRESPGNIDFVLTVIEALPWGIRDNVAHAFVNPLSDDQIRSIALTDRGRILLLRIRDEMLDGIVVASERENAQQIQRVLEGIGRAEAETAEPVTSLPRKRIHLKIVKYDECTLDVDTFVRRTASILRQCAIDVTSSDPINADREQTTDDIGSDAVFDFHMWLFTDVGALRERAGIRGSNQVAVAFAKDIRARPLSGLDGFTQSGDDGAVAVCNRAGTETLAHEIGHFFGLEHVIDPDRLMHEESGTRTEECNLLPWECSVIRSNL